MFVGIKNNKVFDIVSEMENVKSPDDKEVKYIYFEKDIDDIFIDDTWNSVDNINLKDSQYRNLIYENKYIEKSLDDKIDDLEARIEVLENKIGLSSNK